IGRPPRTGELIGAGAVGGFLQGLAAMAGPPIVILLLASSWSAPRCRATLSFIFLLLGSSSVIIGLSRGIMTAADVLLSAYCVPGLASSCGRTLIALICFLICPPRSRYDLRSLDNSSNSLIRRRRKASPSP